MENKALIINKLIHRENVFLTGAAGTGKTYLTKEVVTSLYEKGINVVVTGSTGVSSYNIGGRTIHAVVGSNGANDLSSLSNIVSFIGWKIHISKFLRTIDVLVIDEISMIDGRLLDLISELLKVAKRNRKPFGGIPMLFIGDFLQLPPVYLYGDFQWVFESNAWKSLNLTVIELLENKRQSHKQFTELLWRIRENIVSEEDIDYLNTFKSNMVDEDYPILVGTNREVDQLNHQGLSKLETPETIFSIDVEIVDQNKRKNREKTIKEWLVNLPIKEHLTLKVGAKIMVVKNFANELELYNGTLGVISQIGDRSVEITLENGNTHTIFYVEFEVKNYKGATLGSINQLPLKLSYGMTIHKSQGLTLPGLNIICSNIFAENQFYVGISRVQDPSKLRLINFDPSVIFAESRSIWYYKYLRTFKDYI